MSKCVGSLARWIQILTTPLATHVTVKHASKSMSLYLQNVYLKNICHVHVKQLAGYWCIIIIQILAVSIFLLSSIGFSSDKVILEKLHLKDPCFDEWYNYRRLMYLLI